MGVPSFYRWLIRKYPKVIVKAVTDDSDATSPNPNGEFDNLYLDMNGIIHPCFHPEDHSTPPTTYNEVFGRIFEYIDYLFSIVRPRKLLYMAIDGVAPRAKMNQQRSRRFRTAKDNEIAEAEEERLRELFEKEGKHVLPKLESEVLDSNIITPGTKFMHELSKALQVYAFERLANDASWRGIKVILSDANVPGEGEHKIMSFIRLQRTYPGYNPNTRHCLYGLDADLIMLALATHELHFSILREDVLVQEEQLSCQALLSAGISAAGSNCVESTFRSKYLEKVISKGSSMKQYEFLNIWILREYLRLDFDVIDLPGTLKDIDFERIVDDFIFLCFFSGNDFLPHMPTLEIHEGAIDLLMTVYKEKFKHLGGYLVDMQKVEDQRGGYIELKRVEKFILWVGAFEETIFKKRSELLDRKLKRILREYEDAQRDEEQDEIENVQAPVAIPSSVSAGSTDADDYKILQENTKEMKEKLKEYIKSRSDLFKDGTFGSDKVKLGQVGWKQRYYEYKFSADSRENIENVRKAIVQSYTEGLCWVLKYYFSGVPSWTWFYPYHYGPFASDLKGLGQIKVSFQKGLPFKPFDQLMGVLPSRSAHALPRVYQSLMTDEVSRIIDFYPTDFEVDTEGKRYWWQGVCKLPFIEENRLLLETGKLEKEVEEEEQARNAAGDDKLFVHISTDLGKEMSLLHKNTDCTNLEELIKTYSSLVRNNFWSDGVGGHYEMSQSTNLSDDFQTADVLCVLYKLPDDKLHIPRVLNGVVFPEEILSEDDIAETRLWHEYHGNRPIHRKHQPWKRSAHSPHAPIHNGFSRGRGIGAVEQSDQGSSFVDDRMYYRSSGNGFRGRGIAYGREQIGRNEHQNCDTANHSFGSANRDRMTLWSNHRGLARGREQSSFSNTVEPIGENRMGTRNYGRASAVSTRKTWRAVVDSSQAESTGIGNLMISQCSHGSERAYGRSEPESNRTWYAGDSVANRCSDACQNSSSKGNSQYADYGSTYVGNDGWQRGSKPGFTAYAQDKYYDVSNDRWLHSSQQASRAPSQNLAAHNWHGGLQSSQPAYGAFPHHNFNTTAYNGNYWGKEDRRPFLGASYQNSNWQPRPDGAAGPAQQGACSAVSEPHGRGQYAPTPSAVSYQNSNWQPRPDGAAGPAQQGACSAVSEPHGRGQYAPTPSARGRLGNLRNCNRSYDRR